MSVTLPISNPCWNLVALFDQRPYGIISFSVGCSATVSFTELMVLAAPPLAPPYKF